jgi:hypothetical protein
MVMEGNTEVLTEKIRFEFQAVEIAYAPEKDNGQLDAAVRKGYDLATLTPDFAASEALPE